MKLYCDMHRVATGQGKLIFAKSPGKVREFDCWSGKIWKMMKKSGKILKATKKSGKSQGICFVSDHLKQWSIHNFDVEIPKLPGP